MALWKVYTVPTLESLPVYFKISVHCSAMCVYLCIQNGAEIGYCCRGCRLMRMIDFTNYGYRAASTSDLLQTCTACELKISVILSTLSLYLMIHRQQN